MKKHFSQIRNVYENQFDQNVIAINLKMNLIVNKKLMIWFGWFAIWAEEVFAHTRHNRSEEHTSELQ